MSINHPSKSSSIRTIKITASKSYLQRYIALSSLCEKKSIIKNINLCNDVLAAINAIKQWGASVKIKNNTLEVIGINAKHVYNTIHLDIGESGLSARMLSIISSILFHETHLHGHGSLLNRSMESLISVLQQMGCEVSSHNNHLPLIIKKSHHYPDKITVHHFDTSQIITGLLYALPLLPKNLSIYWKKPISTPYIDISLQVLKHFGIEIIHDNYKSYSLKKTQTLKPVNIEVEGDWSHAAFFVVLGAIKHPCRIEGLHKHSLQGDKIIIDIVQQCGANIKWDSGTLVVVPQHLKPFEIDLTNYPDLFPPLTVLSLAIQGTSVLHGISRLLNKESNRAEVLTREFNKLNANISLEHDKMIIKGKGYLNGGIIDSHNDHRIAMAAAIANFIAQKPIIIRNPEAVNKSYPGFFNIINNLQLQQ